MLITGGAYMQSAFGFNIELTNICVLKCPECPRTQLINQYPNYWKNHNLTLDNLKHFLDVDLQGSQIMLCGNHGDVIYHKDFINIVKWLKQSGSYLIINTNGSHKPQTWWQELVEVLDEQDTVVFSIDGTPDNFTQYRIGADWASIQVGIETVVNSKCQSAWKYIVFNYNENTIEEARLISNMLGVDRFELEYSDRHDTDNFKPRDEYVGVKFFDKAILGSTDIKRSINPKCKDNLHHYISADGYYMPCHYISNKKIWYKTPYGQDKHVYDITKTTFSEMLEKNQSFKFDLPICAWACND